MNQWKYIKYDKPPIHTSVYAYGPYMGYPRICTMNVMENWLDEECVPWTVYWWAELPTVTEEMEKQCLNK